MGVFQKLAAWMVGGNAGRHRVLLLAVFDKNAVSDVLTPSFTACAACLVSYAAKGYTEDQPEPPRTGRGWASHGGAGGERTDVPPIMKEE